MYSCLRMCIHVHCSPMWVTSAANFFFFPQRLGPFWALGSEFGCSFCGLGTSKLLWERSTTKFCFPGSGALLGPGKSILLFSVRSAEKPIDCPILSGAAPRVSRGANSMNVPPSDGWWPSAANFFLQRLGLCGPLERDSLIPSAG